jgi:hypothetical protein
MILKKLIQFTWVAILGLSSFASIHASTGGMGVDVAMPLPVADFDAISDESSFNVNVLHAEGNFKDSDSIYLNYGLRPFRSGQLSTSAMIYKSSFNNSQTTWESQQFEFSLFYNRHFIKQEEDRTFLEGWRPSRYALSGYAGLGWTNTSIDFLNPSGTDPLLSGIKTLNESNNSISFNGGFVANWSVFVRHGISSYINLNQQLAIGTSTFGAYKPAITLGAQYHYRLAKAGLFPPEVVLGLVTSTQSNDADDGNTIGFSLGYTVRY